MCLSDTKAHWLNGQSHATSAMRMPDTGPNSSNSTKVRRLKVWQMREHVECSVVGTCLTHADLQRLLKRCCMQAAPDLPPYDLHAHFVEAVRCEGPLARAVQKLLDQRHEGILRIVGRCTDVNELRKIWDREQAAGRVSGAYWAFQTYAHVPHELHKHIFGEIHMLSHVLGRTVHATAERASELAARVDDLERRLSRQARRHAAALEWRDSQIKLLHRKLATTSVARRVDATPEPPTPQRRDKRDRALMVARERARLAEARVETLASQNHALRQRVAKRPIAAPEQEMNCPGAAACRVRLPTDARLRVLYLGGRTGSVEKLRQIAHSVSAEFHHHDGGREQSFARIGEMIERCHVVFCPVDCINHRACLLAKHHCQRAQKTFVPLRSAGGSTFRQALRSVTIEAE